MYLQIASQVTFIHFRLKRYVQSADTAASALLARGALSPMLTDTGASFLGSLSLNMRTSCPLWTSGGARPAEMNEMNNH